jgi:hypothetical protein
MMSLKDVTVHRKVPGLRSKILVGIWNGIDLSNDVYDYGLVSSRSRLYYEYAS